MHKEEKGRFQHPTPNKHPNAHIKVKKHKTHTKEQDTGWMPSLENWDGGLKIFYGTNSPHTHPVSELTQHTLTRTHKEHSLHTHLYM